MKKMLLIILSLFLLLMSSLPTFAGSIDVELVDDDEALVFIGSVDEFEVTYEEDDYPNTEYTLCITPNKRIKGDVITDKSMRFEKVGTGKLKLQENCNYLFGYMKEKLYIWEIESYNDLFDWEIDNYTEESIILKERHNDTISGGMQELLNTGVFDRAEKERQDLGKQISFAEFLGEDLESSMKIVLSFKDEQFEVDKEKFIKLANEIQITNVKNKTVYDTNYDKVLFVRGVNGDSTTKGRAFVAITPHGEVDRNSPAMSRMLMADYKMEPEDIKKLYELFPYNLQEEIKLSEGLPSDSPLELPAVPKKNYTGWVAGGVAVVFVIAFAIGFVIKKRK